MKAKLIAVGERPPSWLSEGFADYQKRLSHWLPFELVEINPGFRGKSASIARATEDEGERVMAAIVKNSRLISLDVPGRQWNSKQLAERLEFWRTQGQDLCFVIGGPEGHAASVRERADESWSLGPLTLPHMLVRLLVAEQLYRANSMLANHPYHRA